MIQKLILLVGGIAVGKSTYANRLAKEGVICINDDRIVELIHGGDYTLYRKVLKPLYKSIENHIFSTAVAIGRSVCIDRGTNVSARARKRWIGLANSLDIPAVAVVFPLLKPLEHAQRRFDSDSRGLSLDFWYKAAMRHQVDWAEPSREEGFAEVIRLDETSNSSWFKGDIH